MGFYTDVILPRLCNLAMRNRRFVPYRERVVAAAEGRVLEIGIGSGLNLPFYRAPVREVLGLDPASGLIAMAQRVSRAVSIPLNFLEGSAEAIPLDDHSIDSIVTAWTLCTIPQVVAALAEMRVAALEEMRRVLRPGGQLLFVEHGLAPDEDVRRWQDRMTPAWKWISGGCHLNRPIRTLIENAGFRCDLIETGYAPGLKPMAFLDEGRAKPN
jgi:ubiquinone/menaquinone biosynthesis C-methylase UbiE